MREVAVDFEVKRLDVCSQSFKKASCYGAGHAVATIDSNLHAARKLHIAADFFKISRCHIHRFYRTRHVGFDHISGLDRIGNRRNFVTEERQTAQHHLQTVIFRRIVRTGNRNARTATEVMGSEIKHRCRLHADVLNGDTCRHDTLHESR